jgi:hypothetical protein
MKIEVSNGEILDKLTILLIKRQEIQDPVKRNNIEKEYMVLLPLYDQLVTDEQTGKLFRDLHEVNKQLWQVEDELRWLENQQDFGALFIKHARSVYVLNDKRAEIKKEINVVTNSEITEEKSYEKY